MPLKKDKNEKGPNRLKKMAYRFKYGIWAGIATRSGEFLILTPEGQKRARTIKRIPEDKCWDKAFLDSCKGSPWDEDGTDGTRQRVNVDTDGVLVDANDHDEVPDAPVGVRRMKITRKDVAKFGRTPGCRGCMAATSHKHTPRW